MAPVTVRSAPHASHSHQTLDVSEMRGLVAIDGVAGEYEHYFFMVRLSSSRWVTADSDFNLQVLDLANEEVVPLARSSSFPIPGRPFSACRHLDELELAGLRIGAQSFRSFTAWQ